MVVDLNKPLDLDQGGISNGISTGSLNTLCWKLNTASSIIGKGL